MAKSLSLTGVAGVSTVCYAAVAGLAARCAVRIVVDGRLPRWTERQSAQVSDKCFGLIDTSVRQVFRINRFRGDAAVV